jgi:hypothetical protein
MGVAAYYLTFLIGVCSLALMLFGIANDLRNNSYPQYFDEWLLIAGMGFGGWALCQTALAAIFP